MVPPEARCGGEASGGQQVSPPRHGKELRSINLEPRPGKASFNSAFGNALDGSTVAGRHSDCLGEEAPVLGPSGASSCGSASKAKMPEVNRSCFKGKDARSQSRAGTFGVRPLNFGTLERHTPGNIVAPGLLHENPADAGEGSASQLLAGRTAGLLCVNLFWR